MSWLGRALTDTRGEPDVGNLGLFVLVVVIIGAIPFICIMSAVSAFFPSVKFDPQPVGVAVGAVCGGFAAALGAYAATSSGRGKYESDPPK